MDFGGITLTLVLGLLLRFGVPIVVTVLLIIVLKRLDEGWQVEAKDQITRSAKAGALARNVGCWDIKKCSPEMVANCRAYQHPETPCWQVFRGANGLLQERCLLCKIFKEAPVPIEA